MGNATAQTHYASVNGLNMFVLQQGSGSPLVLLHGGLSSTEDSFGVILPLLAETHRVIGSDRQGHGRTADIDRPFSFPQMADDTAALMDQLGIERADVFAYSAGGSVALELALRHPQRIRKLILGSTVYSADGYPPGVFEALKHASTDAMPPVVRQGYERIAPHPEDFPKLVAKSSQQAASDQAGPTEADLQGISIPTLLIVGDGDFVRVEHVVQLFRLLPNAKLAVLPDTDHTLRLYNPGVLVTLIEEFLGAPLSSEESAS